MTVNDVIQKVNMGTVDLNDPFFDSLRKDYAPNFENWFQKKHDEPVYILRTNRGLEGFLYLKDENECDYSITPHFSQKRRLKIGTFKINSHGTVLGQRFINIILSRMINEGFSEVYVTLFDRQRGLIKLFTMFGFRFYGKKANGELVYLKKLDEYDDIYLDYPRISPVGVNKFMVAIYPKFHTRMFPNSRLVTESQHHIEDLSFTNTIEKVYMSNMSGFLQLSHGDIIVIYRTKDARSSAEYSSVVTSVCTVAEVKNVTDFKNFEAYCSYCGKGSVFTKDELERFYTFHQYPYIVKMLYNFSLNKRIICKQLIEVVGISRSAYSGFLKLEDTQFDKIIELGDVHESFIIN
jgi:hypothetical protein